MKVGETVRQGDVLLKRVADHGQAGQKIPRRNGRLIIALGEATGHAHAVATKDAEMFSADDRVFLRMIERGEVTHEEHGAVVLEPHLYEYVPQCQLGDDDEPIFVAD